MILSDEAQIWVIKKVKADIIGLCCDTANSQQFGRELNEIRSFTKLKFLIKNFGNFMDVNVLVDEWSKSGGGENSHWNHVSNIDKFKGYILIANRESKINEII